MRLEFHGTRPAIPTRMGTSKKCTYGRRCYCRSLRRKLLGARHTGTSMGRLNRLGAKHAIGRHPRLTAALRIAPQLAGRAHAPAGSDRANLISTKRVSDYRIKADSPTKL